jgi:iron(III) transport system substrate-binding protein
MRLKASIPLAAALALAAGACGSSSGGSSGGATTAAATPAAPATTAAAAAPATTAAAAPGTTAAAAAPGTTEAAAVPDPTLTVPADFNAKWAALIAEAKKEGAISFVSGPGVDDDNPFLQAFGKEFGLKVSNFGGATDEVTARVSAERDQKIYSYDIGNLGGSGTDNFLKAGFFQDIRPLLINPDAVNHTNFLTDHLPWVDEGKQYCTYYAVEAEGNIGAFYYNTDKVSKADLDSIKSWNDLLDPKWKGKILIGDIASGEDNSDRDLMWVTLGQKWFDGLLANQPFVMPYGSSREYADALIRGDYSIGLFPPGDQSLQDAIDQKLPVAQLDKTLAEGSPRTSIQRNCVLKNAPHPAAAQLFLNWVYTLDGGKTYNEFSKRQGRTHIRADAPMGNIDPTVFQAAHDTSVPFFDEATPEVAQADKDADAYLKQKFSELHIVPGG